MAAKKQPRQEEQKPEKLNPNALKWDLQNLETSLDKLFKFTLGKGQGSVAWYQRKSAPKRNWAQITRVTSIVAAAIGAIWPVLSQMPVGENAAVEIFFNPAWASVALAIAAAAIALDKFFGFSSGWMRFITSQMQIQKLLDAFEYDWMKERASWHDQQPSYEQAQVMIAKCAALAANVAKIEEDETRAWTQEFRSALENLEQTSKQQKAEIEAGAIRVRVSNGDACAEGWILQLEGKAAQTHRGTTGVVANLYPGVYKFTAKGTIADIPVQAEDVVTVEPGGITDISVKLA